MFLELCYWSECWATETVDGILLEALFLALSSGSQCVDDVLLEALFVGLCYVMLLE